MTGMVRLAVSLIGSSELFGPPSRALYRAGHPVLLADIGNRTLFVWERRSSG